MMKIKKGNECVAERENSIQRDDKVRDDEVQN
jgi:hypothetical protein